NKIEDRRYPLSDVQLLQKLQNEFRETRRKFLEHRTATIPKTAIDGRKLGEEQARQFVDAPVGSHVPVSPGGEMPPDTPIAHAFFVPDVPLPSPELYDTGIFRHDMQSAFGLGEAQLGGVSQPKTATEASHVEAGVENRLSERTEEVIGLEKVMAADALEILLQEVPYNSVVPVVGAKAVWPMLSRDQIQSLATIEIKHATMHDIAERRSNWSNVMPLMERLIPLVTQFRAQGLHVVAEPYIELMRETLDRLGERIEVERFLPGGPVGPEQQLPLEVQMAAAAAMGLPQMPTLPKPGMIQTPQTGGPAGAGGPTVGGVGTPSPQSDPGQGQAAGPPIT
ncbi:MAG: hypothetical protein OXF27_01430, partial [Acidobacteria bacterium]|nr:hypothetical protein [Acidobacteriota bacterium]